MADQCKHPPTTPSGFASNYQHQCKRNAVRDGYCTIHHPSYQSPRSRKALDDYESSRNIPKGCCRVTAEIWVDRKPMITKEWPAVDIMKAAATRGWTRRQFNKWLKDFSRATIGTDKVITASWRAVYPPPYHNTISGLLSGVNGKQFREDGIFEK